MQTLTSSVSRVAKTPARSLREGSRFLNDLLIGTLDTPARKAFALQGLCHSLCSAHGIVAHLHGRLPTGPKILVANHMSYIDPVALCSLVPCAPIAKLEVRSWPFVGRMAARYNTMFVRRGDASSGASVLRRAARMLEAGASVLNFPEGTTTTGTPRPFQRGIFGLARLLGVPVVALAVHLDDPDLCWVDDQTFMPHYLRSLRTKPHRVDVSVGPSLWSLDFPTDESHAEAARIWITGQLRRDRMRLTTG